jgi:hypothetical protein
MKNYKTRKVKVQACSAQYRSDGDYLENLSKLDNANSLTTTWATNISPHSVDQDMIGTKPLQTLVISFLSCKRDILC